MVWVSIRHVGIQDPLGSNSLSFEVLPLNRAPCFTYELLSRLDDFLRKHREGPSCSLVWPLI